VLNADVLWEMGITGAGVKVNTFFQVLFRAVKVVSGEKEGGSG